MQLRESQIVELKREVTANFCREVVAFANSEGGSIYVGVDDDGSVCGVECPDELLLRIAQMIETDVEPDVRRYVQLEEEVVDGKTVVRVDVQEGDRKPYCIAQKGYVPAGVYVRVGTACSHASNELIRSMILDSDGESFEEQRCREQRLTFDAARAAFEREGLPLEREHMRTLGALGPDGCYTNLGLLLSDQNPFEIRCAVYSDATPPVFLSRKEFAGSVLKQIEDVLAYFDIVNKVSSHFVGYRRADMHDYPPASLREALLNCVAHRDYGYNGPTLLNFYPDRAQFVSIGGLVKGLTVSDIQLGVSATRNPKLAAILYRLRLVEGYGTGLQTIMATYDFTGCEPIFDAAPNSFVAVLPNLNYGTPASPTASVGANCVQRPPTVVDAVVTLKPSREEALLDLAAMRESFSRQDAEEYLCAGRDATLATLNKLVASGKLAKCGNTRATRYCLPGGSKEAVPPAAAAAPGPNPHTPSSDPLVDRYDPKAARSLQERVATMHRNRR